MGLLSPMEKKASSPLPLPLILLTSDSTNPHIINKHRKIQRVDSFDSLHKDIFCNDKGEKELKNDENIQTESTEMEMEMEKESDEDDMMNFKSVYEYSNRLLSLLTLGYETMSRKISGWCVFGGLNGKERTIWSIAGVSLFLGALIYVRKRDRRERQLLMLLLQEKDQRIAHMLQQITLINDIRSLSSRVPTLRKM